MKTTAQEPPLPHSVLIIQPGAIGDTILTLPLARLLLRQSHATQIDIMGHLSTLAIFNNRTEINSTLSLETASLHRLFADPRTFTFPEPDALITLFSKYQTIVTFLGDPLGHFEQNIIHTVFITHPAEIISIDLHPPADWPKHAANYFIKQLIDQTQTLKLHMSPTLLSGTLIKPTQQDHERGLEILAANHIDHDSTIIAIHPGSGSKQKCWPLQNFRDLATQLTTRDPNTNIITIVGPAEGHITTHQAFADISNITTIVDDLSLTDLACLLTCCKAYIGNDSGPTHLAAAINTPTVAIFKTPTPDTTATYNQSHTSNVTHWHPLGQNSLVCQSQSPEKPWPTTNAVLTALNNLDTPATSVQGV